jgi:hypothetical protein
MRNFIPQTTMVEPCTNFVFSHMSIARMIFEQQKSKKTINPDLPQTRQNHILPLRLYSKKKTWCMGPFAEVVYNCQFHSQISTPTTKGKGWSGWTHLYLSANFKNNQQEKGEYGEREGKGRELTLLYAIARHFMEHIDIFELTLTPRCSWL